LQKYNRNKKEVDEINRGIKKIFTMHNCFGMRKMARRK